MNINDRKNLRFELGNACSRYLAREISNFQLDEVVTKCKSQFLAEELIAQIADELWFLYDDCTKHFVDTHCPLSNSEVTVVRRWILILKSSESDLALIRPMSKEQVNWQMTHLGPRIKSNFYWPFTDEASWDSWKTSARIGE